MDELTEVAEKVFAGRRGPMDPEDDLLYALLSHQPLAARGSTLDFTKEICVGLSDRERGRLHDVLEVLLCGYRNRHDSNRYIAYRPVPPDQAGFPS
jgi:hypothetical protein